jgi:hypothetical protein
LLRVYYGRFLLAPDRTIRNISPQITSAVIPKKIQSDANTERVSTAADVITRASGDQKSTVTMNVAKRG